MAEWGKVRPDGSSTSFFNGISHLKSEMHERALSDFDKAIQLNPSDAQAYCYRGTTYLRLGEYYKSLADFNRAIELNPNYAEAYCYRAGVLINMGDYTRAIADCDRAIRLYPSLADAYFNRASAHTYLRRDDLALPDFDKAIELSPNSPEFYVGRGSSYGELGKYDMALSDLDKAVELDGRHDRAYYGRGLTHLMLGNKEMALSDCGKLRTLNPKAAEKLKNLIDERATLRREVDQVDYDEFAEEFSRRVPLVQDNTLVIDDITAQQLIRASPQHAKAFFDEHLGALERLHTQRAEETRSRKHLQHWDMVLFAIARYFEENDADPSYRARLTDAMNRFARDLED